MQHNVQVLSAAAAVVAVVILVVIYWAYDTCRLNPYLSAAHQKTCAPAAGGSFVGSMGQHPHLTPCAFPAGAGGGWHLNRCNYA